MNPFCTDKDKGIPGSAGRFTLFLFIFLWLSSFLSARIAIYSDTQLNDEAHKDIITEIVARKPDIAFHNGDLTSKGQVQKQYDNWRSITEPLLSICRIYPAKGNHERDKALF
ncbi:MAG TPA: metallophosphoesterase family protein, partial [Candidatus Cloacimonadota bacterium]|nr:metallophosphoesterase family protein [Candidatus Cloacimonadota bacterium]